MPEFSWQEIYSMAKDFGFDGIEIRGLGQDIFSVKAAPFTDKELPKTIAKLKDLRLTIPCLSSGEPINSLETKDKAIAEIRAYIELANKLGTSFIRVLGDRNPAPEKEIDDNVVISIIRELIPYAEEMNVTLLIETNGVYADTKRLKKLLMRSTTARSPLSGICITLTDLWASPQLRQSTTLANISSTFT